MVEHYLDNWDVNGCAGGEREIFPVDHLPWGMYGGWMNDQTFG